MGQSRASCSNTSNRLDPKRRCHEDHPFAGCLDHASQLHDPSFDARFVARGSVPWLVLKMAGTQDGPDGGDVLSKTTFVQRLNTHGGAAPSSGCSQPSDVGAKAFVHYTADYFFYQAEE